MRIQNMVSVGALLTIALSSQAAVTAPQLGRTEAPAVEQAASPTDVAEFTVYLPLRHQEELDALLADLHDSKSPNYQHWLQPSEFMQRFGPSAADLAAVKASLVAHGFTVVKENAHGVRVRGPVSAVSKTFSVPVHSRTQNGRTNYMAKSSLRLPSEIAGLNLRVLGLDAIPHHQVHSRVTGPVNVEAQNRYSPEGAYWFDDLKQAYDYPAFSPKTNGAGVNVAILMEDLLFPDDVAAAFNHEKFTAITGLPVPSVTTVTVDGGGAINGPGALEASLDVQQVLGGAPAANVTLVSVPELSDQDIMDGYNYIVDTNTYDIVNSSFGECELEYTAPFNQGEDLTYILQQYHEIFQQGNAQGITFVASSGDQGGLPCPSPDYGYPGSVNPVFGPGISHPAADPDVTAVGGGNLITTSTAGSLDSAYVRESAFADPDLPYDIFGVGQNVSGGVWGAGGGVSSIFPKPPYQYLANTGSRSWRTNPDVGMQVGGCPLGLAASCGADDSAAVVAYGVGQGGGFYGVIGTSVSSPEFVGALALFEQQLGKHHRMGNANYYIYALGALQTLAGGVNAPAALQFFHRNIPGNDGLWNAGYPSYNYDYIYGNGSPDVRKLFNLRAYPAAGVSQTASNP
jgi:subtilase family serine protease